MKKAQKLIIIFTLIAIANSCANKNIDELAKVLIKTDRVIISYKPYMSDNPVVKQFTTSSHIIAFTDLIFGENTFGTQEIKTTTDQFIEYYSGNTLIFKAYIVLINNETNIFFKNKGTDYLIPMTYGAENIMAGI